MTHYIAMGGEHGCMPDNCMAYANLEDAIDGLDDIYELEIWQLDNLKEFSGGYSSTELNRDQGGAYCEISSCDCSEPWEHAEYDSPDNWPDYAIEDEEETEPSEGDYIISSCGPLGGLTQISKYNENWHYVIKHDKNGNDTDNTYDIIKNEMESEKFWPNVWTLSDHGNYNLITLDSLKKEDEMPLNCIECKKYNVKENTCNESESFFSDENLSIGRCDYFREEE